MPRGQRTKKTGAPEISLESGNSPQAEASKETSDSPQIPSEDMFDSQEAEAGPSEVKSEAPTKSRKVRDPYSKTRLLTRWDLLQDQALLLGLWSASKEAGIELPWGKAAELINCKASADAIQQHLVKVLIARDAESLPVPPLPPNFKMSGTAKASSMLLQVSEQGFKKANSRKRARQELSTAGAVDEMGTIYEPAHDEEGSLGDGESGVKSKKRKRQGPSPDILSKKTKETKEAPVVLQSKDGEPAIMDSNTLPNPGSQTRESQEIVSSANAGHQYSGSNEPDTGGMVHLPNGLVLPGTFFDRTMPINIEPLPNIVGPGPGNAGPAESNWSTAERQHEEAAAALQNEWAAENDFDLNEWVDWNVHPNTE